MNKLNEEKQALEAEINQLHSMINNNQAKIDNLVLDTPDAMRQAKLLDSRILDLNEMLEVKEGRLNQVNYDLELSELNYIKDQQTKRFEAEALSVEAIIALTKAAAAEAAEAAVKVCLCDTEKKEQQAQADPESADQVAVLSLAVDAVTGVHQAATAAATAARAAATAAKQKAEQALNILDTAADQVH